MGEYKDIKKLVCDLKVAAIDAMMKDYGTEYHFEVEDDNYYCKEVQNRSLLAPDVSVRVERPNSKGEGGGKVTCGSSLTSLSDIQDENEVLDDYSERFAECRSAIDAIVSPWIGLPNPYGDGFENAINNYRKGVVAKLSTVPVKGFDAKGLTGDGTDQGAVNILAVKPGSMQRYFDGMMSNAASLQGATMNAFRESFLGTMPSIVRNLSVLAHIHGETLAAEQLIFKQARKKVVEAIEGATKAFAEIPGGGSGFDMLINILVWGCMALSLPFGGAGASTASIIGGVGNLALTAVKDVKAEMKHYEADSYEGIMNELEKSFKDINSNLKKGEQRIEDNLAVNLKAVLGDRNNNDFKTTSFHLLPAPIRDTAGQTKMDRNAVDQLTIGDGSTGGYMSGIAADLESAAKTLRGISMQDLIRRDEEVGIRYGIGPSSTFADLREVIYELLIDLKWRVDEGNVNLRAAMHDFEEQDAQSQQLMDRITNNIEQGSGMDPWDRKHPQKLETLRPNTGQEAVG